MTKLGFEPKPDEKDLRVYDRRACQSFETHVPRNKFGDVGGFNQIGEWVHPVRLPIPPFITGNRPFLGDNRQLP